MKKLKAIWRLIWAKDYAVSTNNNKGTYWYIYGKYGQVRECICGLTNMFNDGIKEESAIAEAQQIIDNQH